ncbi:MAG: DUF1015 domain-containing protein [Endomicrobia bacterium]|nr:DUF1015 domain-containing protein [Endomicrobiia bacterium]
MVEILEFQPLIYNTEKISRQRIEFKDLICPPYDVISPAQHKSLLRKKYNFVNLELPKGSGKIKYKNARKTLTVWKRSKVLVKDEHPSIYVYEHTFKYPEDSQKVYKRTGIFCLVKADYSYEKILPHEQTKPKPLEDRMYLIKTLGVQTSPPFFLVEDSDKEFTNILSGLKKTKYLVLSFKDELGCEHKLYRVIEGIPEVNKIKNYIKQKPLYIADGHHRYKVTCEYLKEINQEFLFGYICSLEDEGLLILPTHRALAEKHIIDGVRKFFEFTDWDGKSKIDIVLYICGEFKVLKLKPQYRFSEKNPYFLLDKILLQLEGEQIRQHIFYHNDLKEVISFADKYGGCAFIMPPVSKEEFVRIIKKRIIFPPKSTYFFPKVPCGLLVFEF